jgi:broad specificity phosphatase PhoE
MSLGIDSTHKRSRRTSDGYGIQRAQVAHAFPPDRLGDSQAYIFPFSGEPYAITANRVDEAKRQLLREAKSIVCSHLSIDQSE